MGMRYTTTITSTTSNQQQGCAKYFNEEKVMEESIATAPTLNTGHSLKVEDDDATTIRSLDSLTGRGQVNVTDDSDDEHLLENLIGGQHYITTSLPGHHHHQGAEAASTCSASTAPTTADEASSPGGDWASFSNDSAAARIRQIHNTNNNNEHTHVVPSWEDSPQSQYANQQQYVDSRNPYTFHLPPSQASYSPAWTQQQQQAHVTSFRGTSEGYPPRAAHVASHHHHHHQYHHQQQSQQHHHQHHHTPPRYGHQNDPMLPLLPPGTGRNPYSRPNNFYLQPQHQTRKPYSPHTTSVTTPPRNTQQRSPARGGGQMSPNRSPAPTSARSPSEVLKTLLRKKACLYEPETSRAVALVTWLVGRELALAHGFFSRQQLQAGVHACVARKIDSGAITRTKVNRCMQIILNSCFHYIIPRPDGTEENGDALRDVFRTNMVDDGHLLRTLSAPWNDLYVDATSVLSANDHHHESPKKVLFETPDSSPRLGSQASPGSPTTPPATDESDAAKRAVLLCFNDNVRSAEDVLRCHNEFIRDTAHSCQLSLSSAEWRQFFGHNNGTTSPQWGTIGIPHKTTKDGRVDAMGVMGEKELNCFRTCWCSKRYEHDHDLCGFAHPEVNGGWLRRDPSVHNYRPQMCPHIVQMGEIVVNKCPHGVHCELAHSMEEIAYHPQRYKQTCITATATTTTTSKPGAFSLVSPYYHAEYRKAETTTRTPAGAAAGATRKKSTVSPSTNHNNTTTANQLLPQGSPICYASPAPLGAYDELLFLPGLQRLYRRNCELSLQKKENRSYDLF